MLNDTLKEGIEKWIDRNYRRGTSKELFIERIKKYSAGYNGRPIIKSQITEDIIEFVKNCLETL